MENNKPVKNPHGGKRENSGRPKLDNPRKMVSYRLSEKEKKAVDEFVYRLKNPSE